LNTNHSNSNNDNYAQLLTEAFYSIENMEILHTLIIKDVFLKSNEEVKINKIKDTTLKQIMDIIWTNQCKFLPYNLKEQIEELDDAVVNYCVTELLKQAEFYFKYLNFLEVSGFLLDLCCLEKFLLHWKYLVQ